MYCLQRSLNRHVSPAVSPELAPWRMADAPKREKLLSWFLDADLDSVGEYRLLCRLTGRPAPDHPRYRAERGTETGRWAGVASSRYELVKRYRLLQLNLRRIRHVWREAGAGLRRGGDPVRAVARLHGEAYLRSELGRSVKLETMPGARALLSSDVRTAAAMLFRWLEDRRYTLDDANVLPWPTVPTMVTTSLASELALSLFLQLTGYKASGICDVCGAAWLRPTARGNPRVCESETCAKAWRRRRRKPEAPGGSTERVRDWRLATKGRVAQEAPRTEASSRTSGQRSQRSAKGDVGSNSAID